MKGEKWILAAIATAGVVLWLTYVGLIIAGLYFGVKFLASLT